VLFKFPETLDDVVIHEDVQGKTWFHAGAICSVLGYKNVSQTVEDHCSDSAQLIQYQEGRGRPALFVSEPGLYLLIMASKNPLAVKFRHWIAYEVLPSIRKTSGYQSKPEDQQYFTPFGLEIQKLDSLIDLARAKGLEPGHVIELHKQLTGHSDPIASQIPAQVTTQAKQRRPSKLASDEERLYQLRKVSAKFGGSATAREVAQFCKAAGSSVEIKKWLYDLVDKGLASAEMVGRCQRFKVL
jgi:prophage antirepressor-like protein